MLSSRFTRELKIKIQNPLYVLFYSTVIFFLIANFSLCQSTFTFRPRIIKEMRKRVTTIMHVFIRMSLPRFFIVGEISLER